MKRVDSSEGLDRQKEEQIIIETVKTLLGMSFEVIRTPAGFPAPSRDMEWLMRCRKRDEIEKAPFLNVIWRQKGDVLWLESLVLGDTIEWIENAYDEESAASSIDIDYAMLDDEGFGKEFGSRYPLVMERIEAYQEIAGRFSSQSWGQLGIRRSGSKGILVFTLAARLNPSRTGPESFVESLGAAVSALREGYSEIMQV